MKKQKNTIRLKFYLILLSMLFIGACSKDDDVIIVDEDEPIVVLPPIALDCNDFDKDVILKNDPDRPVDYTVGCAIEIYATKLTIEPGTVIEFTESGRIAVHRYFDDHSGAIVAIGTADSPIVFRGTKAEKGHWRGLFIGTENNMNELDHVVVRDAGKEPYLHGGQAGLLLGNAGYGYGKVKITNSQFLNNRKYGLEISHNESLTEDYLLIKNNSFKDNEAPVYASIHTLHLLDSSNDLTGNDRDEIDVKSSSNNTDNTRVDGTWYNHGIPYIFERNVYIDSKITLEPGTVLKFPDDSGLTIGRISGPPGTGGGLIAKGTPEEPIVFTATEKIEKYWRGIRFASNYPGNEISNAIVEYTGVITSDPNDVYNLKVLTKSFAKLNNILFRHANHSECAIWVEYFNEWNYGIADVNLETITVEEGHTKYCEH